MKRLVAFLMVLLLFLAFCLAAGGTAEPTAAPEPTYTPEEWLALWYQIGSLLKENGRYPYVELKRGDTGYEVRFLQTRLAELGYYGKEIVDVFGSGTYAAIRQFEKTNGLAVNGVASVEDQRLLFSSLALPASGTQGSANTDSAGDPTNAPGGNDSTFKPGITFKPNIPDLKLPTPKPDNDSTFKPHFTFKPDIPDIILPTPKPTFNIIPLKTPSLNIPSFP